MSGQSEGELVRVPTQLLRKGLYVAELDRPWTEVPTLYQGLEVQTDADIALLQQHCRYVYVIPERSEQFESVTLSKQTSATASTHSQCKHGGTNFAHGPGQGRHPDKREFAVDVQAAANARREARTFLTRALTGVRNRRAIDVETAEEAIDTVVSAVESNANAMVWLTKLTEDDEPVAVHSLNVCILSIHFAMHLALGHQLVRNIALGALLHDIGKAEYAATSASHVDNVSEMANKSGDAHPERGYALVASCGGVAAEVLDIVRLHHETLDGRGYPAGLSGDTIPVHVRIVGLVNEYERLTAADDAALPADEAMQQLYNQADQTYGSDLVQEFIRCVGIFPIGSLVQLDSGALGVVVGSNPESRLRPTVLMVQTPDGEPYHRRVLLNLAVQPSRGAREGATSIRRVVNAAHHDIDVAAIVAFEFGVVLY